MGDHWDDFGDNPDMVAETSEWFTWSVNQSNRIHIFGNHCLHYAFPDKRFQCSGYEQWKYFTINDIVSRKDWNRMIYYHILDGKWLLTHAGLHNLHLPTKIFNLYKNRPLFLKKISDFLDEEIIKGLRGDSWA